ncbi:MAG: hypothetical protein ABIR77_08870 [Sphingomicrobium sp.]
MIKYAGLLLSLIGSAAMASTPASWARLDQRSGRACVAMSGLAYPELLGFKNRFADPIGIDLRMVRGRDAKGVTKRLLCAYNRSTGRAEVQDAGSWSGKAVKP